MTIKELKALLKQGGATFKDGATVTHSSGYQVAILYDGVQYDNTPDEHQALLEAINKGYLKDGGIWYNPSTGKIEVDMLTVHISDRKDAVNLGKHFKQKAILEWETLDSIYL